MFGIDLHCEKYNGALNSFKMSFSSEVKILEQSCIKVKII